MGLSVSLFVGRFSKNYKEDYKTLQNLTKHQSIFILCCFVRYCNFFCNFWRTDRQTDRQTDLGIKASSRSLTKRFHLKTDIDRYISSSVVVCGSYHFLILSMWIFRHLSVPNVPPAIPVNLRKPFPHILKSCSIFSCFPMFVSMNGAGLALMPLLSPCYSLACLLPPLQVWSPLVSNIISVFLVNTYTLGIHRVWKITKIE